MGKRKRSSSKRVSKKRRKSKPRRRKKLPTAFPSTMTTKLKYVETVNLNAEAGGAPVNYHFSANSIYDPNITGTGHQPMGRDQFALLYDHYTVIGSKIKVTYYTTANNTQNIAMWCGTALQDTTNTLDSLPRILEQSGAKGGLLMTGTTQGRKTSGYSQFYSPRKMFRLGNGGIVGNTRICAGINSSPSEDAVFTLLVVQPDGSGTDPVILTALVEIEYIVTFSEKKSLASS